MIRRLAPEPATKHQEPAGCATHSFFKKMSSRSVNGVVMSATSNGGECQLTRRESQYANTTSVTDREFCVAFSVTDPHGARPKRFISAKSAGREPDLSLALDLRNRCSSPSDLTTPAATNWSPTIPNVRSGYAI